VFLRISLGQQKNQISGTKNNKMMMLSYPMMTLHEVWSHNLDHEFAMIRELIEHYPFVAMDTVSSLP